MTIQEYYNSVGGNYAAAKKILMMDKMILRYLPKLAEDPSCVRLKESWEKKDRHGMFEALHSMKGVCANLGLVSLSEKAAKALEPLRPGSTQHVSDAELEKQVSEICAQFDRTISLIKEIDS
ncbi:MAG TPA: hypothetical protein DHV42_03690 [Lachnospiraceae bacterium]|jgi:HPt (histidine-containing phosphotransfer) domain-containing protein|nr:hypothetical protein [Lachnospiraceae bacterium]